MTARPNQSERGFTLVELMISLVLFAVAVAGMLSVAVTMTRSFREQRRVVATEQAVRAPLDFLVDALRQASPGVTTGDVGDADLPCGVTGAIKVIDSTTAPDAIELVYAAGGIVSTAHSAMTSTTNIVALPAVHAAQVAAGDYVLITNLDKGVLRRVVGVSATSLTFATAQCQTIFPAGGFAAGALLVRAQRAQFYVADQTVGTETIPTLWMDPDGPLGAAEPEPIAEGIEDMQIALGVDDDGLTEVVLEENGANPGDDDWFGNVGTETIPLNGKIRAVRVVMVARDTSQLQGPSSFTRPAALNRPAGSADKYRRRVLTSTVEIRNLLGSP